MLFKRNLSCLLAAVSLSVLSSGLVGAKNSVERIDTAETEDLVNRLGHQPELICIRYLHYFLGRPEDAPANRFNPTKHYVWYRPNRRGIKYELVQEEAQPGRVTESTLVLHTDDLDLDLTKVESRFGKAPRKYFDQTTAPTEEYSFAPNTITSFTQKHNTFQISRIAINYKGDPLPPPSMEDMARASLQRKGLGVDHLTHGRYRESIGVLSEHLGENPEDVEAHLALAQAFKANCQINEAIAQYRYTLANSGNFPQVREQCVKDLQDMKVLPSVSADAELQQHQVNLKHKGQRLRRGGLASTKKMPPGLNGADPLNVQPIDPKALSPVIGEPPVAPSFKGDAADLGPAPSSPPTLSPSMPSIDTIPGAGSPSSPNEPF